MPNPFRTLRFRLILLNLAVFGVIIVLFAVVILFVAERFMRQEFDQRLVDGAHSMVEAIEVGEEETTGGPRESRYRPHINPFHFLEYYFQIRLQDGRLLERSPNLGGTGLPLSDAARACRTSGAAVLETIADNTSAAQVDADRQHGPPPAQSQ